MLDELQVFWPTRSNPIVTQTDPRLGYPYIPTRTFVNYLIRKILCIVKSIHERIVILRFFSLSWLEFNNAKQMLLSNVQNSCSVTINIFLALISRVSIRRMFLSHIQYVQGNLKTNKRLLECKVRLMINYSIFTLRLGLFLVGFEFYECLCLIFKSRL